MTTIKDIARECGVSANTVSSVLNNKSGEVSEKTRLRILNAITRLGYRPNAAARRMTGKRTMTIGIADRYTLGPLMDPYKTQILQPIIHTARAARWDVLYYSGHSDEQSGGFSGFLDGRCDGLLCFTGSIEDQEVEAILRTDLPVVFIGETHGKVTRTRSAVIDVDNEKGAYHGVSHLIGLGHTRIAMLQGIGVSGNERRIAGYRRAHMERGLTVDETLIYPTYAWEGGGHEQGAVIVAQHGAERPTAVFCFNDVLALGVLRAIRDNGARCPEDISVVGFDDVFAAATASPPLTTVHQPLDRIGVRAVEMLIGIIMGEIEDHLCEIVAPELVIRASTAPVTPAR